MKLFRNILVFYIITWLSFSAIAASQGRHDDVSKYVSDLTGRAIAVVSNHKLTYNEKVKIASSMLENNLDHIWMAKFVLGAHRRTFSASQLEAFTESYRDFIIWYFSDNFAKFRNEKIQIKSIQEIDDNEFLVQSEVIKSAGRAPIEVNFMVRQKVPNPPEFKVFDTVIEGVSFLTSQRSEYNTILSQQGIEYLTNHLKEAREKSMPKVKNVEIYTKSYCPYCTKAKDFLNRKDISFKEIDVTEDQESLDKASALSNIKTVPQIFVDGKFVSDYSNLLTIEEEGRLDEVFFK